MDLRRLPLPSGVDTANPGSSGFFGRGDQVFASETLRFSLDLFRGDTSFRPAGLRFRCTPDVNLNFLQARERGIVNIDQPVALDPPTVPARLAQPVQCVERPDRLKVRPHASRAMTTRSPA